MRVGLDVSALDPSFKAHAGRGIGRYVTELHSFLSSCATGALSIGTFDHSWFRLSPVAERIVQGLPYGRQTVRQQLCYPLQLRGRRMGMFDFLHFPAHMDAPSWTTKPYVITVLDLIPLKLAHLYKPERPGWRFELARFLEVRAIRGAAHIIAISECTKRDLVETLGIDPARVSVVPLGVDKKFFLEPEAGDMLDVRERYQLPRERALILYVGGIDQRKNISGLLEIAQRVTRRSHEEKREPPLLVLAGRIESDRQYPKLLGEIEKRDLGETTRLLGFVPDGDLRALLATSSLFLFPSYYEGFGLPPLEAQACGVPVVSSSTSSLPEVLGDGALYFAPDDVETGARHVYDVLNERGVAATLSAVGRSNSRRFSWQLTGEKTLDAYSCIARSV